MNSREDFDKIANEIFFPVYEVIAGDALQACGKKSGNCLDVGCGGGHLGLSVAKLSAMQITVPKNINKYKRQYILHIHLQIAL